MCNNIFDIQKEYREDMLKFNFCEKKKINEKGKNKININIH